MILLQFCKFFNSNFHMLQFVNKNKAKLLAYKVKLIHFCLKSGKKTENGYFLPIILAFRKKEIVIALDF